MNKTITNPDNPDETYTYGRRGRKPLWVQQYEKDHPEEVPQKEPKSKAQPVVGPNGKTWSGRGRKPLWVHQLEEQQEAAAGDETWKAWRFVGNEEKPIVEALIVARHDRDALGQLNATLKNPMTLREFYNMWRRVSGGISEDFLQQERPRCMQFDKKTEQWVDRPKNTQVYDTVGV